MPKRIDKQDKYTTRLGLPERDIAPSILDVALAAPQVLAKLNTSCVKQAEEKIDWKLYNIEFVNNNPVLVRELCDRCGKVRIPPRWRRLRGIFTEEAGNVYLEAGICKDCINASVYLDKYFEGQVLTEKEAKELFYKYGEEYERAWRCVLAAAPTTVMTPEEWEHRCKFFMGCAFCGGPIDVQGRFFPRKLNGELTAWNVIPMCTACMTKHYRGRMDVTKATHRYKVFCTHEYFQKTKTIRLYLLRQMEKHNIFIEPLLQYRTRFKETKVLEGSD